MAEIRQVERNIKKVLSHGGFEEIDASIYAALALADTPLSAQQIADKINYAYSTTINALNHLIKRGHVGKRRQGRRNVYFLTTDIASIVQEEVRHFVTLLQRTAHAIHQLDKTHRRRVDHVLDMVQRSMNFLKNVTEVEE